MAAGLDADAVLRALADHPDAFPAVRADAIEFARRAMVKQLKDKAITVDLLRRICAAGGEEAVATILEDWTPAEVAGLVRKADAYSIYAKAGSDEREARRHVAALAAGRAVPSEKAVKREQSARSVKGTKAAKPPGSKIGGVLGSKVHGGEAKPARGTKKR